jgi:flagellar motor switch protein FliM
VEVSLQDIDEVIFSEFLSGLEPPTALFLFNIEELGDWALMEMDPSFCLHCIERQGGSREETVRESRALTRIEERVISRIINKIFKELSHVWSPYLNMTILNHVYESKPANIRTISSHVPGIIIRFEVRVQNMSVPLKICYPYALLKEQMNNSFHEPKKSTGKSVKSSREKKAFENYIKQVSVPLKVILGQVDISMKELIKIEEGHIIKLNQSIDEPLEVLVNGSRKLVGYPGNMNGKKAIKVFEVMNSLKTK